MVRESVDAGGQEEHDGTLSFAREAITDELELTGVRRLSSPISVPLTAGLPCQHRRGREQLGFCFGFSFIIFIDLNASL
jgi:hypothetical protein